MILKVYCSLHLVEAGIGEGMPGERSGIHFRVVYGMGFRCRIVYGVGKDPYVVDYFPGHPAKRVVCNLAMHRAKVYVGLAVHLVIVEGLNRQGVLTDIIIQSLCLSLLY